MSKIISALAIKPPPSISQRDGINIKMYGSGTLYNTLGEESQLPGVEEEKEFEVSAHSKICGIHSLH